MFIDRQRKRAKREDRLSYHGATAPTGPETPHY